MKKTKADRMIDYVMKVMEVAFEEVDLDIPNMNFSSIVCGRRNLYTITAICTEGFCVEAFLGQGKEVSVSIKFRGNKSKLCPLTKLIDNLQELKDNCFDNCEGAK